MPEAHTGIIFTRHFTSSICWMVHNLQGLALEPSGCNSPSVIIAALFKNLNQQENITIDHPFMKILSL